MVLPAGHDGRGRSSWWWVVLAAIVVLTVLVAGRLTRPDVLEVPEHQVPTIVGQLRVEPPRPRAGQVVTLRATLRADRAVTLGRLESVVRHVDESGTAGQKMLGDYALGTSPRELVITEWVRSDGLYRCWLEYRLDGQQDPVVLRLGQFTVLPGPDR